MGGGASMHAPSSTGSGMMGVGGPTSFAGLLGAGGNSRPAAGGASLTRSASMAVGTGTSGASLMRAPSGLGLGTGIGSGMTFGGLTGGGDSRMGMGIGLPPTSFASLGGLGAAGAAAGGFVSAGTGKRVGFVAIPDERSRGASMAAGAGGGINRKRGRDEGHSRDGFPHMLSGGSGLSRSASNVGGSGEGGPTSFGKSLLETIAKTEGAGKKA